MKSNIRKKVMFRVYVEFYKNLLLENAYFIVPIALVGFLTIFVSIPDVLKNIPKNDLHYLYTFSIVAIRDTEILVKIVLLSLTFSIFISGAKHIYNFVHKKRELRGQIMA